MKLFLIITLLICCEFSLAQVFNKKYFTKTDWFTNNTGDTFYKSDTIILLKHNICNKKIDIKAYCESETSQFKHGNIVQLILGKRNKMKLIIKHGNGWTFMKGQKWKFKANNLILQNHKNNSYIFRPINSRHVAVPDEYGAQVLTTELTLIRIK